MMCLGVFLFLFYFIQFNVPFKVISLIETSQSNETNVSLILKAGYSENTEGFAFIKITPQPNKYMQVYNF